MCIPHGATGSRDSGYVDIKPRKEIKRVSQAIFEHGDPDYDGKVIEYMKPKAKKSFFDKLLGL